MRLTTRLTFVLCVCVAGSLYCRTHDTKSDESAIQNLVHRYLAARNANDPAATRSLFTADADQLVSTGEWRKGIDALVAGAMASSRKEGGRSSITIESIRFLDSNVALAEGKYETVSAGTDTSRKMWTTLICQRTGNDWRIAAIRNMLPSPVAPVPNPPKR